MYLLIFYLASIIGIVSIPLCLTFFTALRKQIKRNEYLLNKLIDCKKLYIDTVLIHNKKIREMKTKEMFKTRLKSPDPDEDENPNDDPASPPPPK